MPSNHSPLPNEILLSRPVSCTPQQVWACRRRVWFEVYAAFDRLARLFLIIALIFAPFAPASADLRSAPAWYDQNAVGTLPDWHYRVPINVPAGATVNSTVKVDVDFASLLSAMGVSGSFDVNSPRIVRSTGALATTQEFTDSVFAGATDTVGNNRGEVRFLLQDAGAVTYYLYFDVTQNGSKPANPQTPINGNFERNTAGTGTPTSWNAPTGTATLDAQVVGGGTVSVTSDAGTPLTVNTNGDPNSGQVSYLIGARTNVEGAGTTTRTITRTFVAPATSLGNFAVRWKPQGWDSSGFDTLAITLTDGTTVTNVVGPAYGNYATAPFSPNFGTGAQSTTTSGYTPYNNYDLTSTGTHTQGMTVAAGAEQWWTRSVALPASYAGKTITITITSSQVQAYKSWFLVDDVEWSVLTATLGSPQAFGVNITTPVPTPTYVPGQIIPVTAQVDANPTASTTPVTASLFDSAGTQIAGPFVLYNDGTHGDATAGDAIWTNSGSVVADAVTVAASAATGSGYILRVYARDATTSSIGAQNGLARGPGTGAAAETQTNFWNIDEMTFNVQTAALTVSKSSSPVSDPINGTTNPKLIPGATARYCILISNAGPLAAGTVVMTDTLPANTSFVSGSIRSGTACATAATVEDDDAVGGDESDPVGASFASNTVTAITSTIASAAAVALVFNVTIN